MCDIFISHSNKDRPRAQIFAQVLGTYGWSVFWDRAIRAGGTWREIVGKELQSTRCVIVLWSNASIELDWVQEEADEAKQRHILIPVMINHNLPPIGFRSVQCADLSDWDGTQETPAFRRLIADIVALIGPPPKQLEEASRLQDAVQGTRQPIAGEERRRHGEQEFSEPLDAMGFLAADEADLSLAAPVEAETSQELIGEKKPSSPSILEKSRWFVPAFIAVMAFAGAAVLALMISVEPSVPPPLFEKSASEKTENSQSKVIPLKRTADEVNAGAQVSSETARPQKLSADQGNAQGQANLGVLYEKGLGGLAKDEREAARLYKLSADQGNARGQVNLGVFYHKGLGGLAKDEREAARLYKLAADQGDAQGQVNLGVFYQKGLGGLAKDEREAARLYKLAADHGNAHGQAHLGVFYQKGLGGLAKDEREAARLYKLSADQGDAQGQVNLGFFYERGLGGLAKDEREAARLYKLSADQGNAQAQANLGFFHQKGLGGLSKDKR